MIHSGSWYPKKDHVSSSFRSPQAHGFLTFAEVPRCFLRYVNASLGYSSSLQWTRRSLSRTSTLALELWTQLQSFVGGAWVRTLVTTPPDAAHHLATCISFCNFCMCCMDDTSSHTGQAWMQLKVKLTCPSSHWHAAVSLIGKVHMVVSRHFQKYARTLMCCACES